MAETQVTVTIENLAPENGIFLTPFWVGFHDGNFDTYNRGVAISPAFEPLVEDGNTTLLSQAFLASGNGIVDGTIAGLEDIPNVIDPGEIATATFTLESTAPTSRYFSYASMVLPSNDAFIANGDPLIREIFTENGNFVPTSFIVAGGAVLDGGSEVNDELGENTAFFNQTSPNTGEMENGVVTVHPGLIAGGRILSEDGNSDHAPAAFTNADFTVDEYQVARITVALAEASFPLANPVTLVSELDGSQEVADGDAEALGNSLLTLNNRGDSLEYSLTVEGLDFGANGLIGGGAQTPDISDDVTRIHIHNAARGENGAVLFSLFDTEAPELGNVSGIQGNQDEDLQVTLNNDGSVTLRGIWEETDSANTALSQFVSDIRNAQAGEELDLYWNVHTAEFPDGAIRGQLELSEEQPLPIALVAALDGAQEVTDGDPNAVGNSVLTLNANGDSLEYSLTVAGLDFGANGLIAGGAQTPDTSDDVTRIHIHNAARRENGAVFFSLFDTVIPELGNALNIQGNQDQDLQVNLNDDGSVTLSGIWSETDPANIAFSEVVEEVRNGQTGEELDFYWNIHTEEFPSGAIRGQLLIEKPDVSDARLDTPFVRFQNSQIPGTYIYATGAEADYIRDNLTGFVEEGVAFNAAIENSAGLTALFRLESTQLPGTFLYVGEEELNIINANSNLANAFNNQGIAFYVFGVNANQANPFFRFQNSNVPGTYLYAAESEANIIRANFPSFIDEGTAFEAAI